MKIIITPATGNNPPGKLADAELHFTDGPLDGLKLIGFSIWERRTGNGRNVTFPARSYSVNGERRSFALLRPTGEYAGLTTNGQERVRDLILQAYADWEDARDAPAPTTTISQDVADRIRQSLSTQEQAGIAIGQAIGQAVYGPSALAHPAVQAAATARLSRF